MGKLGRVAIIANPAAQSGAAADVAHRFESLLRKQAPDSEVRMHLTERAGHASETAEHVGRGCDTVIAVGGDGIMHEVANGLMRIPRAERPRVALVPFGSGNDYALTLGISPKPEKALRQILECRTRAFDLGCVNGEYFVETLSFGLDAAIALDTVERRKKSGRRGTILYMESGMDQLLHHLVPQRYKATFGGVPGGGDVVIEGESYVFAVQIGKTYGGHFKICPGAVPDDGLFDVCITTRTLGVLRAVAVFMLARFGLHAGFKTFAFHRASSLEIDFDDPPAAQADGEKVEGTHFEINIVPHALDVVVGKGEA